MSYKHVSNITDLNDCKQIKNHNDDICKTINIELKDIKNTGKHKNIFNIIIIIFFSHKNC